MGGLGTATAQKGDIPLMRPSAPPSRLKAMLKEHRSDPRETLALPVVTAQGAKGVTRDISASGVLFELDRVQQIGSVVDFEIHLDTPDGPLKLVAHGKVVRVTEQGARTGVAVQLVESRLEPGE